MAIQFQWGRKKAADNVQKHRITFGEAVTVFRDPLAFIFDDEAHSERELRELIIGYSSRNRLLIVSFTERNSIIRIISARKAEPDEQEAYERARA
jgi:uncharacterized DUF497 family protein